MILSIIAAIGRNNELGKGNELLWHMPADMKHFRETTSGHPVIMGRKTFESLGVGNDGTPGKPLPNRRNVVITRNMDYKKEGVEIVYALPVALKLFEESKEEVFIIGGSEIYRQALPFADKLYITKIDGEEKEADAHFPEIRNTEWEETYSEPHEADDKNPFAYTFFVYKRI